MIAIRNNFEFRVERSNKSRFYLECIHGAECTWNLKSSTLSNDPPLWVITSYVNVHSCLRDIRSNAHKQATSLLIGECLKSKFVSEDMIEKICPKDIVQLMRKDYGVDTSYYKAWKGRDMALNAIRGKPEDSYSVLPLIADALKEKNSGIYFYVSIILPIKPSEIFDNHQKFLTLLQCFDKSSCLLFM